MSDQPKTAKEWFADADRHFVEAVQRVMVAPLSRHLIGIEAAIDWDPFRHEMARLQRYAEMRHAAKHAATREAMFFTEPVTIYRDGSTPSGSEGGR